VRCSPARAESVSPTASCLVPKSLRQTRWTRLRTFLRGLLLYNTVYWRKASDDARSGHRDRAERAGLAPQVDPGLVQPRVRATPRTAQSAPTITLPNTIGVGTDGDAIAAATALVAALSQALAQSQSASGAAGGQPASPTPGGNESGSPIAPVPTSGKPPVITLDNVVRQRRRRGNRIGESAPAVLSFTLRRKRRRSFWRRLLRWK